MKPMTICRQVLCCLLVVLIIFLVLNNNSKISSKSVRVLGLNIVDIEKEAVNTILIENANGNHYIAFELPKESDMYRRIKEGVELTEPLKSSALDNTLSSTHTSTGSAVHLKNKSSVVIKTPVAKLSNLKPEYPLTVYDDVYYINNKHVCDNGKNLTFVVLVHSATVHFSRRISIRETWANTNLFKHHVIVFLLGKPVRESTQVLIEHENSLYRDIVQGKFMDTYHNLKVVLGVRWVVEHCRNTKLIVKTDDDVFLNVFQLFEAIEQRYSNISRSISCGVRHVNTSKIDRSGKWKVDESQFKNMTFVSFPHCNGFFIVLTPDMFPELFEAAKVMQFFVLDDVYLSGILADKIGGVNFTKVANVHINEKVAVNCFESRHNTCKLLVAAAPTEEVMYKLWYNAIQHNTKLAKKYSRDELFHLS